MRLILAFLLSIAFGAFAQTGPNFNSGPKYNPANVVGSQGSLATAAAWTTCTPTVSLVGGAGNTTPVYSTNACRYQVTGTTVTVHMRLTGDGGAEGAGTGQVSIALPISIGANQLTVVAPCGRTVNGTANYPTTCTLVASSSTIALSYFDTISTLVAVTGDLQNNTSRQINLAFSYEI